MFTSTHIKSFILGLAIGMLLVASGLLALPVDAEVKESLPKWLAIVKDVVPAIEAAGSIVFIVFFFLIANLLSKVPGSFVSLNTPVGKGVLSLADTLGVLDGKNGLLKKLNDDQVDVLKNFKGGTVDQTWLASVPEDGNEQSLLRQLCKDRLLDGDFRVEVNDASSLKLTELGYRVLKDIKGISGVQRADA